MAGGPYNIPRNTKGEGRFLYIFSTKALVVTIIFALIGLGMFYPIGKMVGKNAVYMVGAIAFGVIGFVIMSFKIPNSNNFELTRKAGRRIYISNYY